MQNSNIEWTDHTFNPWWGCQKVSEGCKNCYAETLDKRFGHETHWGPGSARKPMSEKYWRAPIQWNAQATAAGIRAKVFCASMADVFEDHLSVGPWRRMLWELIEKTPNLIWQLLTKRAQNIERMVPMKWLKWFPANVWIGGSAENQERLEEQAAHLAVISCDVRFLSCEPLLGPLTLPVDCNDGSGFFDWIIVGGESGPGARPMHPDWARSLRDQAKEQNAAFFFKQWGEWRPYDHDAGDNARPLGRFQNNVFREGNIVWDGKRESAYMAKVGKKEAGSLLDGVAYKQFPFTEKVTML